MVIQRENRNVFAAIGLCGLLAGWFLRCIACFPTTGNGLLHSAGFGRVGATAPLCSGCRLSERLLVGVGSAGPRRTSLLGERKSIGQRAVGPSKHILGANRVTPA